MSYTDDQSSDEGALLRGHRSSSSSLLSTKFAFPLLDLPSEIILVVIAHVDERDLSPTFPTGPCPELLNLASTNRKFNDLCRPLIWRTVRYVPATHFRPAVYREMRSLATFWDILRDRDNAGTPLPVLALSLDEVYSHDGPLGVEHELVADEQQVALDILAHLTRSTLQVLFAKEFMLSFAGGHRFLDAIARSSTLSAIRLNQVSCWPPLLNLDDRIQRLAKIKTLQIMHSDPAFFKLTHVAPNLDSLLLWPSSRRIATHMDSIKAMLPQLRNLSLDSVHGASAFRQLADEILRLSYTGFTLPLEELFLEGPLSSIDFAIFVSSLAHLPNLRRLALYQCRNPTPTLFDQLHKVVPQLTALTIVAGDCHEGEEWPADLEAYLPSLSRFTNLRFFAFDRRSPTPIDSAGEPIFVTHSQLEFAALSRLGKVCSTLTEAVAIVSDVSEGTTGYFARYERERGRTRINLRLKTVNDFLVGWERWVRVEED
ncbi:F-box domain, cyclin-like domain containing protein [Rhodotorula toruloides]|uniref:F-box domain, cyclin-like domain containing protein n=1 Tax=Rhodotorula toruloides TaxID=5286 RepID=A0A511K9B3_RHOTO|nr:F-box domain, cyclin-like domain containing protein [Rhodotorula toruloides]